MSVNRRRSWRSFAASSQGTVAIEFALMAPLLLLLLAISVELGRAYQAHRCFENSVTGVARSIAALPEYDTRARAYAPLVAAALLPPDWSGKFHLQVTSLEKDNGAMTEIFTHTLFGTKPVVATSAAVGASDFQQSEAAIYVTAAYDYVPLFGALGNATFTMTKSYTINPYFSRRYVWNAAQSADVYVR